MGTPRPFKLERFFAAHEFRVRHMLSASDCETLHISELLALADEDSRSRWDHLRLGYTETSGHPALRTEVSKLYETITPDDVLILAPAEGIFVALHALLSPGDHVIAMHPGFQALTEVARFVGCDVSVWPLRVRGDRWYLDVEELTGLVTPQTRLIVVNFPHNPTGFHPARTDFDRVLEIAQAHELYVLSDEMYRFLEYTPQERLPAACDAYDRAITLSGLSKSFGLPGLRIGWLATRAPGLRERWLTIKDYTTICNSAPSEILALVALRRRDTILKRNLTIIASNLVRAEAFFGAHLPLFHWLPPRAGSVAFPQWCGSQPVEGLSESLRAVGLLMVPGSLFDVGDGYFRLGLGRTDFAEALAILTEFLTRTA
jgi:aspartate/methionine/tyrosine aminotransferase